MKIRDKDEYRRLSAAGMLGNTFRSWPTAAVCRAEYNGWVTVRALEASNKALFIPEIHINRIKSINRGAYLQEVPPPGTHRVANLEAGYIGGVSDPGLHVRYTTGNARNLRHDLDEAGRDVRGAVAARVLREVAGPDVEDLYNLWDRYPDAVVEASVFGCRVGVENKPLIVWEVRDY